LKHKNIVRLRASFLDEVDNLHIVMDICESDIQKYLDSGDRINSFYPGKLSYIKVLFDLFGEYFLFFFSLRILSYCYIFVCLNNNYFR
jgi:hypothetical protein